MNNKIKMKKKKSTAEKVRGGARGWRTAPKIELLFAGPSTFMLSDLAPALQM
jgi:hypothetical protein